jgi:FkbM family methyltransferase
MTSSRALVSVARACYRAMPLRAVRKLAFAAFARAVRNRRTVSTVGEARFDLDLGETIDLSLFLGQYEPEVAAGIRRYTPRGATVFDIGANIGAHTLLLAALVGREGRVIAFEPTDYAFRKLTRNLALNDVPQVEAVQLALSDRRSELEDVNFRSSWRTDGGRKDGRTSVRFDTLDAWCAEKQIGGVDLIKVDVDGNEFPLISGARRTISQYRPVLLMEAVGPHFDNDARNPYRVLSELEYRFRLLKSGAEMTVETMRESLPRNDAAMSVSLNVLAIPAERKVIE